MDARSRVVRQPPEVYTPTRQTSSVPPFALNQGHLFRLQSNEASPLLYSRSLTSSPLNSPYALSPRVPGSLRFNRVRNVFFARDDGKHGAKNQSSPFKIWISGIKNRALSALSENDRSETEFNGWIEAEDRRLQAMFELTSSVIADEDKDQVRSTVFEQLGEVLQEDKRKRELEIQEESASKHRKSDQVDGSTSPLRHEHEKEIQEEDFQVNIDIKDANENGDLRSDVDNDIQIESLETRQQDSTLDQFVVADSVEQVQDESDNQTQQHEILLTEPANENYKVNEEKVQSSDIPEVTEVIIDPSLITAPEPEFNGITDSITNYQNEKLDESKTGYNISEWHRESAIFDNHDENESSAMQGVTAEEQDFLTSHYGSQSGLIPIDPIFGNHVETESYRDAFGPLHKTIPVDPVLNVQDSVHSFHDETDTSAVRSVISQVLQQVEQYEQNVSRSNRKDDENEEEEASQSFTPDMSAIRLWKSLKMRTLMPKAMDQFPVMNFRFSLMKL
ncbi:hypothetical protein V1514DRAFT_38255 [Lipomyces japonicus]|uniref:uncharacterized protein n=1 Tax=Lipomyces japonicus TaxID=56871 RepID=UPI0034CE6E56